MKSGEEHPTEGTVSRRDGTAVGEGRILFFGAHCDDIEIGCGGTACKLAPSRAIAFAIAADCGENRKAEARTAAARLGLGESHGNLFFGFIPDGRLEERNDVLQNWLKDLDSRFKPDAVYVHHGADTHPDHETLYKVVLRVFVHQAIYLYPIPKLAAQAVAFQPNCYEDISDFIRAKLELCACHVSQASKGIYLDPEQIKATARVAYVTGFGQAGGYAEAFRIHVTRSSGLLPAVPDSSSHSARPPAPTSSASRPGPSASSAATFPVPVSEGQGGRAFSRLAAEGPSPTPGVTFHGDVRDAVFNFGPQQGVISTGNHAIVTQATPPLGQLPSPASHIDRSTLRDALNSKSVDEIREIGAVLDAGLSAGMTKPAAVAAMLDWATTPARQHALHNAIRESA